MKSVSVSVKLDRSIKAEQAIGLETSCTGLETNWKKKKRTLWRQPQSPAETFRIEMPKTTNLS